MLASALHRDYLYLPCADLKHVDFIIEFFLKSRQPKWAHDKDVKTDWASTEQNMDAMISKSEFVVPYWAALNN